MGRVVSYEAGARRASHDGISVALLRRSDRRHTLGLGGLIMLKFVLLIVVLPLLIGIALPSMARRVEEIAKWLNDRNWPSYIADEQTLKVLKGTGLLIVYFGWHWSAWLIWEYLTDEEGHCDRLLWGAWREMIIEPSQMETRTSDSVGWRYRAWIQCRNAYRVVSPSRVRLDQFVGVWVRLYRRCNDVEVLTHTSWLYTARDMVGDWGAGRRASRSLVQALAA